MLWKAQEIHRKYHDANKIQISTLMSIKTGGCPEDCKYCSQSIRYDTDINLEKTLPLVDIIKQAQEAKKKMGPLDSVWEQHGETSLKAI